MKNILTIAGFDPTGGAGLQADLRVFANFKLQGLSAVTAVTAQDGVRVTMVEPVNRAVLRKQLDTLLGAHNVEALKIGMLGTGTLADVVRLAIKRHGLKNVVLDTVLASSSGKKLIDKNGVVALKKLLPLARVITPNIIEAGILTGTAIKNIKDMEAAAVELYRLGAQNVLITGGHLRGAPIDVLYDGKRFHHFTGTRIKANKKNLHGTGCILSSAIAAKLAKGRTVKTAVKEAKLFLEKSILKRIKNS
jgi:hydroxymethylpyrimidine/phosphomethylpyrimidine kinase